MIKQCFRGFGVFYWLLELEVFSTSSGDLAVTTIYLPRSPLVPVTLVVVVLLVVAHVVWSCHAFNFL